MQLLTWNDQNSLSLTDRLCEDEVPPYAILSHTWGADHEEVTFSDLQHGLGRYLYKAGYKKLEFCGEQARRDGIKHFWVDTCCINQADLAELSEAILSMYRWYQNAQTCYVYMSDVEAFPKESDRNVQLAWSHNFRSSRWFTRGWTLQELLAPPVVKFFSQDLDFLGTKETLVNWICETTTIPLAALRGYPLSQFPVSERIRWTQGRVTRKKEDKAYCLLGLFNVYMPLMYGEGDNAILRLQKAINEQHAANVAAGLSDNSTASALLSRRSSASVANPSDFVDDTCYEIGAWCDAIDSTKACWSDWDTSGDLHYRFFTHNGEIKFFQWNNKRGHYTSSRNPRSPWVPSRLVREVEKQLNVPHSFPSVPCSAAGITKLHKPEMADEQGDHKAELSESDGHYESDIKKRSKVVTEGEKKR